MISTQCSKHVEEYNKHYKTRICAISWSITKIILRCTVSKALKNNLTCYSLLFEMYKRIIVFRENLRSNYTLTSNTQSLQM